MNNQNPYVNAERARCDRISSGTTLFPEHIRAAESLCAGYLLAKLAKISRQYDNSEFHISDADLCQETGMTLSQLSRARRKLLATNIFEMKRKGWPARPYYAINNKIYVDKVLPKC